MSPGGDPDGRGSISSREWLRGLVVIAVVVVIVVLLFFLANGPRAA